MQTEARTAPINIRARHTQRELIDRAAAAQHKSRSDFILEAACKEAENVLLDQRLFLLDERQVAEFAAALRQGMAGNRQLETLLSRPAPWEE
jgi:uncharacterized protein (DUF1778 family)